MVAEPSAYIAGSKFGLGLAPGDLGFIDTDPRGWLLDQLSWSDSLPVDYGSLEHSAVLLNQARDALRQQAIAQQSMAAAGTAAAQPDLQTIRKNMRAMLEVAVAHQQLRLRVAVSSRLPFIERLVRFWSNHFTIAAGGGAKRVLGPVALPYENEAIRARLAGSFADMLLAVEQHPAMLIYLDNALSAGPNSLLGRRQKRGLNENLAREILELHTLGVDGGYRQQDVTSLAAMITGWTVAQDDRPGPAGVQAAGMFQFVPAMHEPGAQTLLGKRYAADGVKQGERALRDLARHPSTARHLATKLVRHFVADQPPQAAVTVIEEVFLDTGGHLPSVHAALVELDAAWDPMLRKLKTPEELVISTGRALRPQLATGSRSATALATALRTFGQAPFTAPSPAGWPDSAEFWGNPDSLLKRIEWAAALAQLLPATLDTLALFESVLPEDAHLRREITRAESNQQALALLLASPQFQWR